MIAAPVASAGVFGIGLAWGFWSVSHGWPDISLLKARAELRQARARVQATLDSLPARRESALRDPAQAARIASEIENEVSEVSMTNLYRMRERLRDRKDLEAHVKAIDSIYAVGFWDRLREMGEGKQPPGPVLEAAGRDLGVLVSRLSDLERRLVELFPWLGD